MSIGSFSLHIGINPCNTNSPKKKTPSDKNSETS